MRRIIGIVVCAVTFWFQAVAQVDTTYIYNNSTPYGSLDIRIYKSSTWYYYLQENKTFSFRERTPGVKTDRYFDMTSWDSSPYLQGNLREINGDHDDFVMNYRLLPPQGYNASYSPGYPLIILLHGALESANCRDNDCYFADNTWSPAVNDPPAPTDSTSKVLNNDHQLTNGGTAHLKARNDAGSKLPNDPSLSARAFPGFVLFPQSLNGWDGTSAQDAIRIVRLLCKKYNIDENRIYIEGLSNGGHGVFETVKRAPWMFACALTMSALDDGFINSQGMASSIANIPLWMFQGAKDTNPYPQKTENFIKQFRDAGADIRYTKYDNLGHGTWATAYLEPDFFSWILSHNRSDLHVFAGNPTICGSNGLKLEMPAGYKAYQWRLNGQLISGANAASYTATTAGTYSARFSRVDNPSESQWNSWSNPVEVKAGQALPKAQINQIGTVILNDLNNLTDARLQAVGDFAHYYWYKDGTRVDLPGDQDDTTRTAIIKPAMGKGVYTLVTSNFDNCQSPASDGKYVFFNNQAPLNIADPTNFKGTPNASSGVDLTWTDASNNENGFEIWRRKKTGDTTYDPWAMATLTTSNVSSFKDASVEASTTYQYKIRAVSTTGRSNYVPGSSALELKTTADTQPPTAPDSLRAKAIGVQKILLTWGASTDNTGMGQYYIYFGSDSVATADTTFVLTNLALNTVFNFTVRAFDRSGNRSAPSNQAQGSTYMAGLFYEHNTGSESDLDSIDWSSPEFTGWVPTFTLAPKTQEDFFNFRFDGFLYITHPGTYQFRTSSDDGSRLTLDSKVLVDNDGIHTLKTVTSNNQTLTEGSHRITVDFFDYTETDTLIVEYKGPDTNNEWAPIKADALKSSENVVTGLEKDQRSEPIMTISIFPNPTSQDNINIRIESGSPSPVQIQLLDGTGRNIMHGVVPIEDLSNDIRLATPGFVAEGMYIVVAKQGKTTVRQRLIIKR